MSLASRLGEIVVMFLQEGRTVRQIANEYGASPVTIKMLLAGAGVNLRRPAVVNEPRRVVREHKPLQERYTSDPHAPSADSHSDHVDRVMYQSRNKGFPVAPAPRVWP